MDSAMLAMYAAAQPAAPPSPPQPPEAPQPPAAEAPVTGTEVPAPGVITIERDGKIIRFDPAVAGNEIFAGTEAPVPFDMPPRVYELARDGIVGFTLMVIAFPVFGFLKALLNRRASAQAALPSRDVTDRLTRIESAVEAMSVEVERISEGQRFVTKVLSERVSSQH